MMANFGFSISDIVLVGNYAYTVYQSCKNAGADFKEITADVNSLQTHLDALQTEYRNPQSSFRHLPPDEEDNLADRVRDCKIDLVSVKRVLRKFRSLDTDDPQYRDQLTFTRKRRDELRQKIATHNTRLQQLLSSLNVGTLSRIERNTEATYLSLLEVHAKLDRIWKEIFSGRRGAVAIEDTDALVALEDEILADNRAEANVDILSVIDQWIEQVDRSKRQSMNEHQHSRSPSTVDNNASLASVDHLPGAESIDEISTDATGGALITYNDRKLTTAPNPWLSLPNNVALRGEAYHFQAGEDRWKLVKYWNCAPPGYLSTIRNTFYVLDFSLEEAFSGAVRHIGVRRTIMDPNDHHTAPNEDISLDVEAKKGFFENESIQYLEAGNQTPNGIESINFVLRRKRHDVFQAHLSNLTHKIVISIIEANEGWRRELTHPSGVVIEIYANGPTNVGHFLQMENYGIPLRAVANSWGDLLLWIQVMDIEKVPAEQLDRLELRGGAYFARRRGEGDVHESAEEQPFNLRTFGAPAREHSQILSARSEKRMDDAKRSSRRKVALPEAKRRSRSSSRKR